MMHHLFELWWTAWADYAYYVRVYEQSLDHPKTAGEIERQTKKEMYDDLRKIHSHGILERDITNEMLLFSVANGFTMNLQFVIDMNKSNRCVRAQRLTDRFPGCGTSLLNLSTKHTATFNWLCRKPNPKRHHIQQAQDFTFWYDTHNLINTTTKYLEIRLNFLKMDKNLTLSA